MTCSHPKKLFVKHMRNASFLRMPASMQYECKISGARSSTSSRRSDYDDAAHAATLAWNAKGYAFNGSKMDCVFKFDSAELPSIGTNKTLLFKATATLNGFSHTEMIRVRSNNLKARGIPHPKEALYHVMSSSATVDWNAKGHSFDDNKVSYVCRFLSTESGAQNKNQRVRFKAIANLHDQSWENEFSVRSNNLKNGIPLPSEARYHVILPLVAARMSQLHKVSYRLTSVEKSPDSEDCEDCVHAQFAMEGVFVDADCIHPKVQTI